MNVPVCVCCGQPIAGKPSFHGRNPNICAACSELADGLEVHDQPKQTETISAKWQSPKETRPIRKAA